MIETYIIEQLAALARYGTLSRVAEELHTSQPALSRSMQKLEDELGVSLFDRSKNRIALNELGLLAARHAQAVMDAHGELVRAVREADRRRRTFAYGSIAPAPIWELTPVISQLYMGMAVSADLRDTEEALLGGLADGAYNLAVLLRPQDGGRYYSQPYLRERLSVLLPRGHRLAARKSLRLADLAGESILIHTEIGFWYALCRQKIPGATFLEQGDLATLRQIVGAAELPSFTTNLSVQPGALPKNKVAVPLDDAEADARYYCVCLAERQKEYAALFSALAGREG